MKHSTQPTKTKTVRIECRVCKAVFYVWPCLSRTKYCSRECFGEDELGNKNPNWHGGIIQDKQGYMRMWHRGRHLREHRVIMEKHLGRALTRSEYVHHVNEDKSDNRIENLQILTASEHKLLHPTPQRAPIVKNGHRTCKMCRQSLPIGYFHKLKRDKFGYMTRCKNCWYQYKKRTGNI